MKLTLVTSVLAAMASATQAFDLQGKVLLNAKILASRQKNIQTLANGHENANRLLQEDCTTAYDESGASLLFGGACTVVDDVCPDTCQAELDALNDVCEGKTYTDIDGVEQPYDHAAEIAVYKLLLEDACADTIDIGDAVVSCDGAFSAVSGDIVFGSTCEEASDGTCPADCTAMILDLHEICEGEMLDDGDGNRFPYNAKEAAAGFQLFLDGACATADFSDPSAAVRSYWNAVIPLALGSLFLVFF